jgi:hypothetical protein
MQEFTKSLDQIVAIFERNLIEQTLKHNHGNESKAARALGISKRKIQYRISKYHIDFRKIRKVYGEGDACREGWRRHSNPCKGDVQRERLLLS